MGKDRTINNIIQIVVFNGWLPGLVDEFMIFLTQGMWFMGRSPLSGDTFVALKMKKKQHKSRVGPGLFYVPFFIIYLALSQTIGDKS